MKVVTGVVGNDIHVVANRLIELSLDARGYEVFNLGVNTYLEEFFDAVVETGAEILMISSLNGEAEGWSREVKLLKAKYKGLDDLIMMIGGNLVVGTGNAEDIIPRYKNYGFDIVCHQVDLNTGLDMLETLLEERSIKSSNTIKNTTKNKTKNTTKNITESND
ncbi:MAG: methylaspartate mutase subunit S [Colwellia sp.]|nr:methylaspartate mutase subunit S [Colwellia sp.]